MIAYEADVGTWKSGKIVSIIAHNAKQAYTAAAKFIPPDGESTVVQIRERPSGRCVYDFMNGFEMYERMEPK